MLHIISCQLMSEVTFFTHRCTMIAKCVHSWHFSVILICEVGGIPEPVNSYYLLWSFIVFSGNMEHALTFLYYIWDYDMDSVRILQAPQFIPTIPPNLNWETQTCEWRHRHVSEDTCASKLYIGLSNRHIMKIKNISKHSQSDTWWPLWWI